MHNASTAQEVKIITPTAKDFEFRVSRTIIQEIYWAYCQIVSVNFKALERSQPHAALSHPG